MTLENWYTNNSRPLALQEAIKNPIIAETLEFLKERGLPKASDMNGVAGPDRVSMLAELQARYAGWHDCIRMFLSLASPRNQSQLPEVLEQYSEEYVRKIMRENGTPLPTPEKSPRKTRKS